jgi:hypothetical protein
VTGECGFLERTALAREIGEPLHLVERQAQGLRSLQSLRRDDRAARARALRDLLRELSRVVRLEGHEDDTDAKRGEEGDDVFGAVHSPDEDAVTLPEAAVAEVARDARDDVVQISVCPGACAKTRPDHERLFVSELPSGLLDDVVECLHVASPYPLARERTQRLASPLPYRWIVREQDRFHVELREPRDGAAREAHVVGEEVVRKRHLPAHALQQITDDQ